jgi:hypothetical protein
MKNARLDDPCTLAPEGPAVRPASGVQAVVCVFMMQTTRRMAHAHWRAF